MLRLGIRRCRPSALPVGSFHQVESSWGVASSSHFANRAHYSDGYRDQQQSYSRYGHHDRDSPVGGYSSRSEFQYRNRGSSNVYDNRGGGNTQDYGVRSGGNNNRKVFVRGGWNPQKYEAGGGRNTNDDGVASGGYNHDYGVRSDGNDYRYGARGGWNIQRYGPRGGGYSNGYGDRGGGYSNDYGDRGGGYNNDYGGRGGGYDNDYGDRGSVNAYNRNSYYDQGQRNQTYGDRNQRNQSDYRDRLDYSDFRSSGGQGQGQQRNSQRSFEGQQGQWRQSSRDFNGHDRQEQTWQRGRMAWNGSRNGQGLDRPSRRTSDQRYTDAPTEDMHDYMPDFTSEHAFSDPFPDTDFPSSEATESRRRSRINMKKAPPAKDWRDTEFRRENHEEGEAFHEGPKKKAKKLKPVAVPEVPKEIFLPQVISVSNLSRLLGVKLRMLQKIMHSIALTDSRPDALLSFDDASLICAECDLEAISNDEAAFDIYPAPPPSAAERSSLPYRPPVVAVMGHVDHGKTSLLDRLRSASVAAGEAGGITQHIGAFSVPVKSAASSDAISAVSRITFLDTPGHAAFSNMRARGAKVTDIVVLVVAADDGVMTQTKEVIALYQSLEAEATASAEEDRREEAKNQETDGSILQTDGPTDGPQRKKQNNIQLIVALSKCDRREANVQRAKEQLGTEGIFVEELGGDVPCVEISSKTGQGFEDFEETLAAMAELGDLRAPVDGAPEGFILESRTEKGWGNTATVLVTRGTLKVGDNLIAGHTWAKVRQMMDSNGQTVELGPPGEAVLVAGWKDLPSAGDEVLSATKEEEVRKAVANRLDGEERKKMMQVAIAVNEQRRKIQEQEDREAKRLEVERQRKRAQRLAESEGRVYEEDHNATEDEKDSAEKSEPDIKALRLVIKADYSGTGEALVGALAGVVTKDARIKIVSVGVGDISEEDVSMARALGGHIIGFNVNAPRKVQDEVDTLNKVRGGSGSGGVYIYTSPIIYQIIEYVSSALLKLLPPLVETRVHGEATIAQIFSINIKNRKYANIAGCKVTNGTIDKSRLIRIVREEKKGRGDEEHERKTIWQGRISSLKHVKKEVTEMRKGTECGISFEDFQGFEQGDIVQSIELVEVPRTL